MLIENYSLRRLPEKSALRGSHSAFQISQGSHSAFVWQRLAIQDDGSSALSLPGGSVKALASGQKKCGFAGIPDANYSIFCFHQEIELDVLKFQKPFHLPPAFGVMNRHNFTFTTLPWLTSQLCFLVPLFFWSEGFFGSQRPLPGGLKATMLRCCLRPIAFKHPNRGTSITYQFSKSKNSVDFGNVGLLPGIWSVFQSKPML